MNRRERMLAVVVVALLGVLGLRIAMVCGGIAVAMTAGADPLGLALGLSLVMPATLIAALWNRPQVVEQAADPGLDPDDPSWDRYSIWRAAEREEDEETQ